MITTCKKRTFLVIGAALVLAMAYILPAQEATPDDAFFSGSDEALVTEVGQAATAPAANPDAAATTGATGDTVKIGGNISFSTGLSFDPESWGPGFDWKGDTASSLDLASTLFVDARPSQDFRVFAKGKAEYPFTEASNFTLREAFADLTIANSLYVRLGKQTINWGVGRFFSPANVINLGNKDPENPDLELLGPVAAKLQLPLDAANYYLYAILQDMETKDSVGIGAKGEWVIGDAELSLGGVYRADQPWAATATFSTKLWQFDIYGEGVLKGQDDRTYVVEDAASPIGVATETREDDLELAATAGFSWSWNDDNSWINLAVTGQYYYNGAGYADPELLQNHQAGIGALMATGKLGTADLFQRGRHYAALSVALTDLFKTDFGLSVFWLGNLQDASGKVSNTISYSGIDKLKFSVSYTMGYGKTGSEYSPAGSSQSLEFSVDLVNANF